MESVSTFFYTPGVPSDEEDVARLASREGMIDAGKAFQAAMREPFGFTLVVRRKTEGRSEVVAFEIAFLLRSSTSKSLQEGKETFGGLLDSHDGALFPDEQQVGRANARSGSDVLLSHFVYSSRLPPWEQARVKAQLASTFIDLYGGNRIRAILFQVASPDVAAIARPGGYETIADYANVEFESHERPLLLRYTDHDPTHHNLLIMRLLHYRPPVLRLPPGGREIVRFAAMGLSDAQIVERYGIRSSSLNSRWTRALDIAEAKMPELFHGQGTVKARDRMPLLAYVRNHPEELWPYSP